MLPIGSDGHRVLDALVQLRSLLGTRLGEDDRELVASDAARDVRRAKNGAYPQRRLGEDTVAGEVADLLVDRLEVVEIEHEQGKAAPVAVRARAFAHERLVEEASVAQARERIRIREPTRLAVAERVVERGDGAAHDVDDLFTDLRAESRECAGVDRERAERCRARPRAETDSFEPSSPWRSASSRDIPADFTMPPFSSPSSARTAASTPSRSSELSRMRATTSSRSSDPATSGLLLGRASRSLLSSARCRAGPAERPLRRRRQPQRPSRPRSREPSLLSCRGPADRAASPVGRFLCRKGDSCRP